MRKALYGSKNEGGTHSIASSPITEATMEIDGYSDFIVGIVCLAENNGFIYTVTSTGYRYTLNIKMLVVEIGSLIKYKVELYHLRSGIELDTVREMVLSGRACHGDSCFPVEIYIEGSGRHGVATAYPSRLFDSGELAELIRALRVDGTRCRG